MTHIIQQVALGLVMVSGERHATIHNVRLLTLPFMKGLNPLLKSRQIMAAYFERELAPSLNSF